jgi:hypothetical protein
MQSVVGQINNLRTTLKNYQMDSHKTLKNPSESRRRCRLTQLIGNSLIVVIQSLSELSLTQIIDQQTQSHNHAQRSEKCGLGVSPSGAPFQESNAFG